MRTVYINLFSNASTDDGDLNSIDRISKIGIEIDHEKNWEMPEMELSQDMRNNIEDVMEKFIAEKWDASDYESDPDDAYDFEREDRS